MPSIPLEQTIERACVELARACGALALKGDLSAAHWPDRLFLFPGGRLLLVEFKRPGGQLRPAQRLRHAEIAALGFTVHVVDSIDRFNVLLNRLECYRHD